MAYPGLSTWASVRLPNCNGTSRMPVEQISPDKNVNFHDATAAFTVSPESGASSCGADLPGDSALYAVSVPRIGSGAGLAHRFALRLPSDGPSRFRPRIRSGRLLPSASTCVSANMPLTGFTYRGLSPHKFTPMPGVQLSHDPIVQSLVHTSIGVLTDSSSTFSATG